MAGEQPDAGEARDLRDLALREEPLGDSALIEDLDQSGRVERAAGRSAVRLSGSDLMRLWSLHPKYLDPKGLAALWREALLAQAVLRGQTRGYRQHPQLERFRSHGSPRCAINAYLAVVHAEASSRGYAFDRSKIGPVRPVPPISVTRGQIQHEWQHLLAKLAARSPAWFEQWSGVERPTCHPLFRCGSGGVATWERKPPRAPLRQPSKA